MLMLNVDILRGNLFIGLRNVNISRGMLYLPILFRHDSRLNPIVFIRGMFTGKAY